MYQKYPTACCKIKKERGITMNEITIKGTYGSMKVFTDELESLSGQNLEDYLHDIDIMQRFASLNRCVIKEVILGGLKLTDTEAVKVMRDVTSKEVAPLNINEIATDGGLLNCILWES